MARVIVRFALFIAVCMVGLLIVVDRAHAQPLPVSGLGSAPGTTDEYVELKDAWTRFTNNDVAGAVDYLEAAVKKHKELAPAQVILAQFFARANNAAGMRASLEKAVIDEPGDPQAYAILGDMALQGRRVTDAAVLYEKAAGLLESFDGSAKRKKQMQQGTAMGLATVAEARGDWKTAQAQLEAVVALASDNAQALERLGRAIYKQGDADAALVQLKKAAVENEKLLTPEAMLALYYEQDKDDENSRKWMVKALTLAPDDLKTRLAAGQWAVRDQEYKEAATQADLALKIDPDSLAAKLLRGVVALFQKDYPTAEKHFQSAHIQSPGNFVASNNLAIALVEQDDEAKKRLAREFAEVNARQYPKQGEVFSTLGWIYYKLGNLGDAEKALVQSVQISKGKASADTKYYLARIYADQDNEKKKESAKQLAESALETKGAFSLREECEALLKELK